MPPEVIDQVHRLARRAKSNKTTLQFTNLHNEDLDVLLGTSDDGDESDPVDDVGTAGVDDPADADDEDDVDDSSYDPGPSRQTWRAWAAFQPSKDPQERLQGRPWRNNRRRGADHDAAVRW